MVGAKEDVRVIGLTGFFQRIKDTADLRVHVLDDRVILLPVHFHRVVGARERPKFFVAQPGAAADVVLVRILIEVAAGTLIRLNG